MSTVENDPAKGLNAAVAATLNGERAAAKVTFDELAGMTGISKRTLMRLLSTTERHIDVQALESISTALGLSVQDVIGMSTARMQRGSLRENLDVIRAAMQRAERGQREA